MPIAWSSRKTPRVVRSTLSAEAIALSGALDRLSWIRLMWEWTKDPGVNISNPEALLTHAPISVVATGCKSVYDLTTRTSTPSCEEYRTCIECILIRERLRDNCKTRWVHSQAQLADTLTKSMDGSLLRECLATGQYSLFDEQIQLKARADKRNRLAWIKKNLSELN